MLLFREAITSSIFAQFDQTVEFVSHHLTIPLLETHVHQLEHGLEIVGHNGYLVFVLLICSGLIRRCCIIIRSRIPCKQVFANDFVHFLGAFHDFHQSSIVLFRKLAQLQFIFAQLHIIEELGAVDSVLVANGDRRKAETQRRAQFDIRGDLN